MTSTISTAQRKDAPSGVLATLRETPVQVRYLLGGVLVNQMGAFVQTFLVLYLTARQLSVGQAGFALTAYSVGAVLGTILGGELTQRFGPRATIVGAMSTSAVILALVPTLSGPGRFGLLLAAIALAGLATQSYRPAAAVLLSDLIPDEHRVMGFSMMRIAMNGGAALSPLIAAGLILVDWDLLFYLDAATALGYALLALTLLPKVSAPQEEEPADEPAERRGAYAVLFRDGRYLAFLASVLLGSVIYVQYTVALPLKITEEGHPAALYSGVLTASSVILILCELKITSYVKGWKPYVAGAGGTALMGLGVAGYGLPFGSSVTIVACTVLFVFGVMTSGPTMFAHPATYPAAVKARYIAAHQATFGLGMALGPTLGVFAWSTLGNGIWALCGVFGVIAALCARVGMRGNLAS
ncbi:MFS family permease [Kitasatospora gansuensis]|uniref:MFS family permease n=1 Tax=Kitasatospora gansuensis TaxID=258050 RepID=A0A7W7WFX8_9ACTN|nr:MFS transporter [Kitasatospora gansuensis]MBB4944864.1 MFS family permease [Kitasatospora gansuensis]